MALPTRKLRDVIKQECNATFVIMLLDEETQQKRIKERHSEGDQAADQSTIDYLISIHKLYEPVQEDEENAVDLYIEPEMSLEDVASKVLKLTQDLDRKSV